MRDDPISVSKSSIFRCVTMHKSWSRLVRMSMLEAINNALDITLKSCEKSMVFGADVSFGGVFRCTRGLQAKYGNDRVFNTPLTEQGIVGFSIGLASNGWFPIAEIQFSDYLYPALDQIINEAAKYRYRSGGEFNCGGLVIRCPCGTIGHGGHYHSQSPEAYLCHTSGLKVVMPSNPADAKGLLLSCIADQNPCIFLEPKTLYRSSICEVKNDRMVPLNKARIVCCGTDLTIISYGSQIHTVMRATRILKDIRPSLSVEVIDLRTLLPYDTETIVESVKRTGRVLVTHEAPETGGYGAEIVSFLAKHCFLYLEAPPSLVCGLDSPVPHINENSYLPNENRLLKKIIEVCDF